MEHERNWHTHELINTIVFQYFHLATYNDYIDAPYEN